MPKAKQPKTATPASKTGAKPAAQAKPTPTEDGDRLPWPQISLKKGLSVDCVIPDQIYVIDNLLTPAECARWVAFGETLELEAPKPAGKDEAERTNFRFQTYAPRFAAQLHTALAPYLTDKAFATPTPAKGLYPKIRIYDYPPQTFFRPHYDDAARDPRTGLHSRWTLLVYLTGAPDVGGGETVFWTREPNARGRKGESLEVGLRAGRAVLHRHGAGCLVHEGKEVGRGHKWVLRSDVMYDE